MEIITISGHLLEDAELINDKNGRPYIRFVVRGEKAIFDNSTKQMVYRCWSYKPEFAGMKKNDFVVVNGEYTINIKNNIISFTIHAKDISIGV